MNYDRMMGFFWGATAAASIAFAYLSPTMFFAIYFCEFAFVAIAACILFGPVKHA